MNFGPIGIQEILIIVVVALLIFGPRQLPKIAKDAAKAVKGFRKEVQSLKDDIDLTK